MLARSLIACRSLGAIHRLALLFACFLIGCQGTSSQTRPDAPVNPPPSTVAQSAPINASVPVPPLPPVTYKGAADMVEAENAYRNEDWVKAAKHFGIVAEEKSNPPQIAEKARFFEAEAKRMQFRYPSAMSTYNRLLMDFERGVFREKAVGRMFEIANYWLDDTRKQMDAQREKLDGKRVSVPWNFVHFLDKTKPDFDEEGHALKMLEQVYFNDPTGPYAERALYMAGFVQFHRKKFKEADQLLTQLIEMDDRNGKKSKLRDQAIELVILAKNNSTGGPDYDGRKAAEALRLIHQTKMTNPELASERGEFLDNQQKMIRYMQAEKDYNIAEFYLRTGHPASAWFYYELVRRRYHGTEFHDKAVAKMTEIRGDLETQKHESELAKSARRKWDKWAFGHDTPTLADGKEVPRLPGQLNGNSGVMQAQDLQSVGPKDIVAPPK